MAFPLSGMILQVVIFVCRDAGIHYPFPVWEGEDLLAGGTLLPEFCWKR